MVTLTCARNHCSVSSIVHTILKVASGVRRDCGLAVRCRRSPAIAHIPPVRLSLVSVFPRHKLSRFSARTCLWLPKVWFLNRVGSAINRTLIKEGTAKCCVVPNSSRCCCY